MAEGTEIAKAYVQIIPSAKGIKGKIAKELGGEANEAGKSLGSALVGKIKGVIATAGIGKAIASSLNAGAELQQSIGGIETLFKENADVVKKYANEAYKTAGLSANAYMETVTSFSASLLQGLGGDTKKAAESANMAITDMSDNANKMGTSMELIQNAYQGFAKQNYTMLDNLKLGYGGTKTEMQRLLKDAEALSGIKYDINNLNDVYSAIHVIQDELGITGTTSKEAASTFTGSLAAMKSAGKNLLANLSLGKDIGPSLSDLEDTAHTFFVNNMIPMVGNVIKSAPQALQSALNFAVRGMNIAKNNSQEIVQMGIDIISNLVVGVVTQIPYLAEAALGLVGAFGKTILETDWPTLGKNIINELKSELNIASWEILGTDTNIIESICGGISENIPQLIKSAGDLILQLVGGLISGIPLILQSGSDLVMGLVFGILSEGCITQIIGSAIQVVAQFLGGIGTRLPDILQQGITIIGELIAGLISSIPDLVMSAKDIIGNAADAFKSYDWKGIGKNIIDGIINGIVNAAGALYKSLKDLAKNALDAAKKAFDINSPSVLFEKAVGWFIPPGIAEGIRKNTQPLIEAMRNLAGITTDAYRPDLKSSVLKNTSRLLNKR